MLVVRARDISSSYRRTVMFRKSSKRFAVSAVLSCVVLSVAAYCSAIQPGGVIGKATPFVRVFYNPNGGAVWVDAPDGVELSEIDIDSKVGIFTGEQPENLGPLPSEADEFGILKGHLPGQLWFGQFRKCGANWFVPRICAQRT